MRFDQYAAAQYQTARTPVTAKNEASASEFFLEDRIKTEMKSQVREEIEDELKANFKKELKDKIERELKEQIQREQQEKFAQQISQLKEQYEQKSQLALSEEK